MKYITAIGLVFFFLISSAQSIYVEGGLLIHKIYLEEPIAYSENNTQQDEFMLIGYEHHFPNFYNSYVSFDYSYYFIGVNITIKNPENGWGFGTTFNEGHVFAAGIRIPKTFYNRLSISGGLYIKYIKINRTWPDSYKNYLGDYPYSGYYDSKVYPGVRIQPEIRFAVDIRFLWRMHFYINSGFTKGFSRWQDITFVYSLYGEPQPTTVAYNNGTGFNLNVGLKFDIVSQVKEK